MKQLSGKLRLLTLVAEREPHAVRLARHLRSGPDDSDGADRHPCRSSFSSPFPTRRRCSSALSPLQLRSAALPRAWSAPPLRWSLPRCSSSTTTPRPATTPPIWPPVLMLAVTAAGTAAITGLLRKRLMDAFAWERRHHATAARLSAALDQVDIGIVLLDSDTRAEFINRAFRDYFSLSGPEGRQQAAVHRADVSRPRHRRLRDAGGGVERLHRRAHRDDARRQFDADQHQPRGRTRCCVSVARRCPTADEC